MTPLQVASGGVLDWAGLAKINVVYILLVVLIMFIHFIFYLPRSLVFLYSSGTQIQYSQRPDTFHDTSLLLSHH